MPYPTAEGGIEVPSAHRLQDRYKEVRATTMRICAPLEAEDFVVQPADHVSPPKWHLAHTTWFFETFLLQPHLQGYKVYHPDFAFIFNSYYESLGERALRAERGNLSRPTVTSLYGYRAHVDEAMERLLSAQNEISDEVTNLIEIGLQHEMQHQELLYTDIKYILGQNPLMPVYHPDVQIDTIAPKVDRDWLGLKAGQYTIGHNGEGFAFDNEYGRHEVYLHDFAIASGLVTHADYIAFIEDGGYSNFRHWHSDGWAWVKAHSAKAPRYMHYINGQWQRYTLAGLRPCNDASPVMHVNFYEASAYAAWKGLRLPTEQEWEVASSHFSWGELWEWTGSAYLPYPGYVQPKGAIGEYNGKFMVNQIVLRGASKATYPGHSRPTYRNFFQPNFQWQFTGIRLAKSL